MNKFSERLANLMEEQGLSVRELSEQADVHKATLYGCLHDDGYVKHTPHPRIDTVDRLADVLGVSIDYLWGKTDKR